MSDDPRIEQPKQLIVEGNDDARVFASLSRHLGIQDIQTWQCDGYENIRGVLGTVTGLDDFDSVRSLAVVADANSSRNSRIQTDVTHSGMNSRLGISHFSYEIALTCVRSDPKYSKRLV